MPRPGFAGSISRRRESADSHFPHTTATAKGPSSITCPPNSTVCGAAEESTIDTSAFSHASFSLTVFVEFRLFTRRSARLWRNERLRQNAAGRAVCLHELVAWREVVMDQFQHPEPRIRAPVFQSTILTLGNCVGYPTSCDSPAISIPMRVASDTRTRKSAPDAFQ